MTQVIDRFLAEQKTMIDRRLMELMNRLEVPEKLKDSMVYSLKAGGKRLRPILLLSVIEALGKQPKAGLDAACSLEMLHTYSLIHDDLPAMDNDTLRRGQPTNHIVFGEATAILAGDALLTFSFECLANSEELDPATIVQLTLELAKSAGPEGMVGGQLCDLEAEGKTILLKELESIHHRKTGQLLSYAVKAGAIIAGASSNQMDQLNEFAKHLGIAFQIKDDILDIEGDQALIGKPVGSDQESEKSTYPSLLTMDGAKKALEHHYDLALDALKQANVNGSILEELTRYTIERSN